MFARDFEHPPVASPTFADHIRSLTMADPQSPEEAIRANVIMFSGSKDEQTSADVFDISSFDLPSDAGPGGAGGACTNSLLSM
eukprot:1172682-Prorocentrum_minimum.AAC.5